MAVESVLEIVTTLDKMEHKYANLVWYAETDPEECSLPLDNTTDDVLLRRDAIEAAYPVDVASMNEPDTSDWAMGFNRGMLACIHFVQTARCDGLEAARDRFPEDVV